MAKQKYETVEKHTATQILLIDAVDYVTKDKGAGRRPEEYYAFVDFINAEKKRYGVR